MNLFSLRSLFLLLAAPTEPVEAAIAPTVSSVAEVVESTLAPVAEATAVQAAAHLDWSLVIAIAALAFSVASPIFSAWISGHYQLKQKQLEFNNAKELRQQQFYDEHRAQVIENFITTAGAAIQEQTFQTMNAFGRSAGEIYLYLPEKLWPLVEAVSEDLTSGETKGAAESLTILCKKLSAENVRPHDQAEPKRVDKK